MEEDKIFFLPFLRKEQLTRDTYSFFFERTHEAPDFVAGQYFEIKLAIKNPDERGDTHVFTCASSPTERQHIMITTRIIESTFKKTLVRLRPRQKVQFSGPWNDLNFDESEESPQVFLAGGIGITPFHSIIRYAMDKKLNLQMTLFVSWSSEDEIIWDDFFQKAEKRLEGFRYIPTITQNAGKLWRGETGRISERMIKKYVQKVKNAKYRIAGPPGLVKAMRELVIQMNVGKENILFEDFEGY